MRLSHLLTLFAGGATVALAVLATRNDAPRQPRVETRTAPDPRLDHLLARLDRVEELLVAERPAQSDTNVEERLDRIESMLVEERVSAPVAQTPNGIPPEVLRVRAKGLSKDLSKSADAIEAWRLVAERTSDPEKKAEAYFEQGEVYRQLDDYGAAAKSWQKVVDTVGLDSKRGQTAAYQLGFAQAYQQDHQTAYRTFRELAAAPNLSKAMDSAVRLQVAGFARVTGDVGTARREYQRYIDDYGNDDAEHFRNLAKTAEEQLRRLP